MPYNPEVLDRIRLVLDEKGVTYTEKTMFSGVCTMVDDKMLCATHTDKKTGEEMLLCRVGEAYYETALEEPHVIPMDFTGKSMKGYIYVMEDGFKRKKELEYWLQKCLDFNPIAKSSKKKVVKK